jgi:hypothetical protein
VFGLILIAAALGLSNFAAAIGIGLSGLDARVRIRVPYGVPYFARCTAVGGGAKRTPELSVQPLTYSNVSVVAVPNRRETPFVAVPKPCAQVRILAGAPQTNASVRDRTLVALSRDQLDRGAMLGVPRSSALPNGRGVPSRYRKLMGNSMPERCWGS